MSVRPPLTVVVPCRNRPALVAECVARLRADLGPEDRVIVADSASDDDGVRRAAEAAGASVVRCERPGTSRARNAGWRAATTDFVAFVDDDVMVSPGWSSALLDAFSTDVEFVIGHTTAPAGHTGSATSVISVAPPTVITDATGVGAAGGNVAFRRSALARVGGYDERLGPGARFPAGEDLELLDRVLEGGSTGRYAAAAVATHEQWRPDADALRMQWSYGEGMGARVACALRRRPRRGIRMLPEVFRLRGIATFGRRLRRSPGAASVAEPSSPLGGGWRGPVLWRLGAVWGLVRGLARLGPDGSAPEPSPAEAAA